MEIDRFTKFSISYISADTPRILLETKTNEIYIVLFLIC
jgi:hypothetical protein